MITTPETILQKVSNDLREITTETGSRRVSFFNEAVKHVLGKFKWAWSRKIGTLDVDAGIQEYDLVTEFTDYSILRGVYEVYIDGAKITPSIKEKASEASESAKTYWYLDNDNKTIGFTTTLDGTEDIEITYYATHTDATAYNDTLNLPLPEEIGTLVGIYILFLEHRSKKQRNDARNAMIDFTDLLDDLRPQDASNKGKDLKKTIPPVMSYMGFRRTYRH